MRLMLQKHVVPSPDAVLCCDSSSPSGSASEGWREEENLTIVLKSHVESAHCQSAFNCAIFGS